MDTPKNDHFDSLPLVFGPESEGFFVAELLKNQETSVSVKVVNEIGRENLKNFTVRSYERHHSGCIYLSTAMV